VDIFSKASDVLNHMFMEQRHTRQMEELEQDMKVELERSKEELNRQLELELQEELKVLPMCMWNKLLIIQ